MDHELQLMLEVRQRTCQNRLTILPDVGAVLTCGAGSYEVVCDRVALAGICLADIRANVVRAGLQGIDSEF